MSVLVAIPCYGGLMHVGCVGSVVAIADACRDAEIACDFLITHGESAVTRARSNMVTRFLQTTYKTLAFIDADIRITGANFLRLLALERPIRGAAVNLKTLDGSEALSCYIDGRRLPRAEMGAEPFVCDALGGAVMLIERVVLERMSAQFPELEYVDPELGPGTHLFAEAVDHDVLLSEDYAFCRRAAACGFKTWCDPTIKVDHCEGRTVWRH